MRRIENYGDERQWRACVHCGGSPESRDHMPSKVLLDEPYPDDLPVVWSCAPCNRGLSLDEEYVACLVECVRTGSADPRDVDRPNVSRILSDSPKLRSRLARARDDIAGGIFFCPEYQRVRRILLKLARGHAMFELNERHYEEPAYVAAVPLQTVSRGERETFEVVAATQTWPEVGSRAMQRLVELGAGRIGWQIVQPGRYRYAVTWSDGVVVRIVLSEYLACEVRWS